MMMQRGSYPSVLYARSNHVEAHVVSVVSQLAEQASTGVCF